MQGALVNAKLAEGALVRVDLVDPVLFPDGFAGANFPAAPALIAYPDFKNSRFRKFPVDVDGRFFGVVLLEMG
jgi:hypothetical protein